MIAVDTNVLIWGVKRVATPDRLTMIPKAQAFLEQCSERKTRIVVPSQVLEEYLVSFDDSARKMQLHLLQRSFFIAPHDAQAAFIAAEIRHKKDLLDGIKADYGVSRQVIKADVNVVATAIAAGATHLYTEDGHVKRLALGKILVCPLPEPATKTRQRLLPGDE